MPRAPAPFAGPGSPRRVLLTWEVAGVDLPPSPPPRGGRGLLGEAGSQSPPGRGLGTHLPLVSQPQQQPRGLGGRTGVHRHGRALPTSSHGARSRLRWRLFSRGARPARSRSPSCAPECCTGGWGRPSGGAFPVSPRVRGETPVRRASEPLAPLSCPAPGSLSVLGETVPESYWGPRDAGEGSVEGRHVRFPPRRPGCAHRLSASALGGAAGPHRPRAAVPFLLQAQFQRPAPSP